MPYKHIYTIQLKNSTYYKQKELVMKKKFLDGSEYFYWRFSYFIEQSASLTKKYIQYN